MSADIAFYILRDLCYLLANVVILVFRINICAFHLALGCTFYYDFSSVVIIIVVWMVLWLLLSGWLVCVCWLEWLAPPLIFTLRYVSTLLCAPTARAFFTLFSLCTLLRQRQLFNKFCFVPQHIKKCTASLSLHSFSFVSFRFLVFVVFGCSSCYALLNR